jgi:hypothetical protein
LLLPVPFALFPLLVEFPDRPPLAHTGGFGEPTCQECHFGNSLNDSTGSLAIAGLPAEYVPGAVYPVSVGLVRAGLNAGGFELAARVAGGAAAGQQAGRLEATDPRVDVADSTLARHGTVTYARNTTAGSSPSGQHTATWVLKWTAPTTRIGAVVFHVTANAANGDNSPLDDYIYASSATVEAAGEREKGNREE